MPDIDIEAARAVARVIQEADGGCCMCVDDLCERAGKEFPRFQFTRNTADRFGEVDVFALDGIPPGV